MDRASRIGVGLALALVGAAMFLVWLLHYLLESRALSEGPAGVLVYPLALILPSGVFWLALWTGEHAGLDARATSLFASLVLWGALLALSAGVTLMAWGEVDAIEGHPALAALLTSAYACGWALLLAGLIQRTTFRRWLISGGGRSAFSTSAAFALAWWLQARFGTTLDSRAEQWIALALVTWYVGALALCFLGLLSPQRREVIFAVAGLAVLGGFLLLTYLVAGLLFSGAHFWPFVLLIALIAEGAVVRAVVPRLLLR